MLLLGTLLLLSFLPPCTSCITTWPVLPAHTPSFHVVNASVPFTGSNGSYQVWRIGPNQQERAEKWQASQTLRLSANDARDRALWLESFKSATQPIQLQGVLTGGSIANKRFELEVDDEIYKGSISDSAREQMQHIRFGARVQAKIDETTLTAEDGSTEGSITHHLTSLDVLS